MRRKPTVVLSSAALLLAAMTGDGLASPRAAVREEAEEASDAWFMDGGVGLWTKSDSISEFDDVSFEPLGP